MAARKKKTDEAAAAKLTGKVKGGALYIRSKAGLDGDKVGVLENGSQIEIIEAGPEWHRIEKGYVMARWVELDATEEK